jgi:thioredoxin-related protein
MKKILIILPLLFGSIHAEELATIENTITNTSQLGELSNVYNNYAQALRVAKKSKKNLFILFEKEYCPWCTKLKNITLQDRQLTELLNRDFVVVILDKNRDKFPAQYDPSRVPVVYMANFNEKVFVKKLGYNRNPNEYIRLSKYITP